MKRNALYETLNETIKQRIPERGKLTTRLVDVLCIEKEAVYRRLRGEVPFTFTEVAILAKEFNISLDNLIGTSSPDSRPFQIKMLEYLNPTEIDYYMFQEFINLLRVPGNGLYSEFGFVSSMFPLHFSLRYLNIHRFYLLRWAYQFGSPGNLYNFSEIKITDKYKKLIKDFLTEIESVTYTFFIWDEQLFYYLVNDIKYFVEIHLINDEELKTLKNEINTLIDDMELLAAKGTFSSGQKVHFYVSNLNFETTYTYLETSDYYLTMIKTFTLNELSSFDKEVFMKMKTWIQALKRTSNLISESGEIQRVMFFEKQREYVSRL